jgi:HSP20 family protein
MVREKKSFFGKLMASEDLPAQPVEINHTEIVYEEPEMQPMEEVENDSQLAEQPSAERSTDEWPAEYEGELYIDMYQTKDNVVVKSTIAGVPPEDLDITIANDMLTIRGERKRIEKIDQGDYFFQECYWGGFSRSVILPIDIDSENIEAELKDGILTVILPKAAKAKTKKIKIKG